MILRIQKVVDLQIDTLNEMLLESKSNGFNAISRLITDWTSGSNRFDRPGEALFLAQEADRCIGTCGLNLDPYAQSVTVGRIRRLYVLSDYRRQSIGRSLEQMIQTALHQPTFNVETVQGDFMPEHRGININAGDNANISGVSSGDGVVNLGEISGNVTNTINQLPESSEPEQLSIKTLLTQLQQAIESDADLSTPDKSDLLEQVKSLAEAKKAEEPEKREGIVRKAMKMFDATLKSLPDTAKIVEACSNTVSRSKSSFGDVESRSSN